ncbi:hypothetical protein PanWU01x14_304840 [Parasponia andersonii]|uniref:Uncharacterized protein n=1 Tax=Parasponia andersonii TaxID=3476 RepID=A0A2P5ASI8_PARAD|nr:hypothetical protein PanWU01x14_304840 [Parasponia andersonii]
MYAVYKSSKGGLSSCPTFPPAPATAAVVVILMMTTIKCCAAAVLVKGNATYDRYCINGGVANENCLIAEDLDLEFLMDSHVSRMLADAKPKPKPKPASGGSEIQGSAVQPCGETEKGEPNCMDEAMSRPKGLSIYDKNPPL